MAISSNYLRYVLERLSTLRGLSSRRIFGGLGLHCEGVFFGLMMKGVEWGRSGRTVIGRRSA